MILYHVTEEDKLKSILVNGLKPIKNDLRSNACVYLWDDIEFAADTYGMIDRYHPRTFANAIMLKVDVPKSWLVLDDGYNQTEAQYGQAFKCFRKINKDRINIIESYAE
jgi:hypothetical protein